MRFIKDTEKEQLKRLVKACMLEISKLKMDLKKCRQENNYSPSTKQSDSQTEINLKQNIELENILKEKDENIFELKQILEEKNKQINELEEIRSYFKAVTAKPKKNLTSFQSQIYQLLPSEEANTKELHLLIKNIGFKELTFDNMLHILRNLERKGYYSSKRDNKEIFWQKIEK